MWQASRYAQEAESSLLEPQTQSQESRPQEEKDFSWLSPLPVIQFLQ